MLSNNNLCLRAVHVTIFSNSSIIPPSFKFMKLHALTLATHSYALLATAIECWLFMLSMLQFGFIQVQALAHLHLPWFRSLWYQQNMN